MKRRRPNTGRKTPADLLHRWESDLFSARAARSLFDVLEKPVEVSAGKPNGCVETPTRLTAHTVHCYVMVCVKLTGVLAESPREAARWVQQNFRWEDHGRDVEFVDELHEMLVDVAGDPDYSQSVAFRADLEPVRQEH